MTKIAKILRIRQIDPKNIQKVCNFTAKILLMTKSAGFGLKILLLVPKPTGQLLLSCRNNLQFWTLCLWSNLILIYPNHLNYFQIHQITPKSDVINRSLTFLVHDN